MTNIYFGENQEGLGDQAFLFSCRCDWNWMPFTVIGKKWRLSLKDRKPWSVPCCSMQQAPRSIVGSERPAPDASMGSAKFGGLDDALAARHIGAAVRARQQAPGRLTRQRRAALRCDVQLYEEADIQEAQKSLACGLLRKFCGS